MAKGEEIIKYVTQKVVQYIETPSDHRKQLRLRRKNTSEPWTVRWFGLIPISLSLLFHRPHKKVPSAGADSAQGNRYMEEEKNR